MRYATLKRYLDVLGSALGLLALSPVFVILCLAIWLEDRSNPFYVGTRVGLKGRRFGMIKFRSMRPHADRAGVDSTSATDPRITRVGLVIRRLKLDEIPQLLNVLKGDMSLVGPRPQVLRGVGLYTAVEEGLLLARPGVTDFASLIFADESEILRGSQDPDLRYHQVIRPWKSRLGLHYVKSQSFMLDVRLMQATILNSFDRARALAWVSAMLEQTGAEPDLVYAASRVEPLEPLPPPGSQFVVTSREGAVHG